MKKYLVLYKSETSASDQMADADPEKAKEGVDAWNKWTEEAGDAVVDDGMPLDHGMKITKEGAEMMDHSKIGGYSIIQADSVEDVKKMMAMHPHLMVEGNKIVVLEMLPMPGME